MVIVSRETIIFYQQNRTLFLQKNVSRETFHIKTRTKTIVEVIIKVIIEVLINITKKLKQKQ